MVNVRWHNSPPLPEYLPEQIARYFFTALMDDNGEPTEYFRCKVCSREYKQVGGRGFTNLAQHVKVKHVDYKDQMDEATSGETGSLRSWVSHKAQMRFAWIDWVVTSNLPLSFVEDPQTRRNTKLTKISASTLRRDMLALTTALEKIIGAELPDFFGIVFDGWTHMSEYYLAVFATYTVNGVAKKPLLSLAPIVYSPDDSHDATTHMSAITEVLSVFGKTIEQVVFLVGDNCAVNKRLARLMGCPLVRCASHRLNLAVKVLLQKHDADMNKIQKIMVNLRTLNHSKTLRFKTDLRPVLRQDTRWSSAFCMLSRFFELRPHIDQEDEALSELLPTGSRTKRLKSLLSNLKDVESVSKKIQSDNITMAEVRALFDALMDVFPDFQSYLAPDAAIVGDPNFETAVTKLQQGRNADMTAAKVAAVRKLHDRRKRPSSATSADEPKLGFADRVLKRAKVSEDSYTLAQAVLPTSNMAERLFSVARLTLGLDRNALHPVMLEATLFLKVNRDYWGVELVHQCLEANE